MPARRLSKSRTATPAVSDSEEAPEAAAAADAQEEAAANKGKLRKATPDQQDTGPPKKRRKRSSSKTPEASEGAEASAAPDGQVCHYCHLRTTILYRAQTLTLAVRRCVM